MVKELDPEVRDPRAAPLPHTRIVVVPGAVATGTASPRHEPIDTDGTSPPPTLKQFSPPL